MQSIIEKTAMFISKQSSQMEIVLKTKQSGNPQFAFLNFDDYMNPYYKFILGKIKEGVFTPKEEKKEDTDPKDTSGKDKQKVDPEKVAGMIPFCMESCFKCSFDYFKKGYQLYFALLFRPDLKICCFVITQPGLQETCRSKKIFIFIPEKDFFSHKYINAIFSISR